MIMVSNLDYYLLFFLVADSLNDFSSGVMNFNEFYFFYMFFRISLVNYYDFFVRMLVLVCWWFLDMGFNFVEDNDGGIFVLLWWFVVGLRWEEVSYRFVK